MILIWNPKPGYIKCELFRLSLLCKKRRYDWAIIQYSINLFTNSNWINKQCQPYRPDTRYALKSNTYPPRHGFSSICFKKYSQTFFYVCYLLFSFISPDLGRSVNHISTGGRADYAHQIILFSTPGFSDLPLALHLTQASFLQK